jgi:hypothetical protein
MYEYEFNLDTPFGEITIHVEYEYKAGLPETPIEPAEPAEINIGNFYIEVDGKRELTNIWKAMTGEILDELRDDIREKHES